MEVQLALANNIKTSRAILNRLNQSQYSEVVKAVNLHVNFVGELSEGVEEKIKELVLKSVSYNQRIDYVALKVLTQICAIPKFIVEHWVQESRYQDFCKELVLRSDININYNLLVFCKQKLIFHSSLNN